MERLLLHGGVVRPESGLTVKTDGEVRARVCLVTGAARGIGKATAEVLGAAGTTVVVADTSELGAHTADGIRTAGGQAVFIQGDVSTAEGAANIVASAVAEFGVLDSLINNAGILRLAPSFEQTTIAQLHELMQINFESVFHMSKAALPSLEKSGRGSIVNTASMVGVRIGMPSHAIYGASKAAVVGLSMTMAIELAPRGVRVNCVAPGVVATDLFAEEFLKSNSSKDLESGGKATLAAIPLGSYARPEQVAEVIAFLAGSASDYVTGQTIVIDGGFTGI